MLIIKQKDKKKLAAKKWYLKNKKKANNASAKWRKNNPERVKENTRKRAKYYIYKNFTEKTYLQLKVNQKNVCAICKRKGHKLYVDHCHSKNTVRALLCHNCNTLLGHAHDDIEVLKSAVKYLKNHEQR